MARQTRSDLLLLFSGLSIGILAGLALVVGLNESMRNSLVNLFTIKDNASIGAPAPEFELISLSGEQVRLSDYSGKAVMINFWATWCTPCRLEMPLLDKYQKRYPSNLVILAVNMQESEPDIHIFSNELDLKIQILLDPDSVVSKLYKVQGLPTTFFLDQAGKIREIHIGSLSDEQLAGYLHKIGVEQ